MVLFSVRSFDCPDKCIFTEILGSPKASHAAHRLRSISQTARARHFGLKAISLRVKHVWTVYLSGLPWEQQDDLQTLLAKEPQVEPH